MSKQVPTVLVVDDRPENLLTVEAVLKPLQVQVQTALRGEAALQFLLREDVAVILLDVEMPGMDGLDTARLIRQRPRSSDTPIIFITAVDRGDDAVRSGYELGAVDYIVKPFHPDILRWKVSVFAELYKSRQKERFLIEEQLRRTEAEGAAKRTKILADVAKILASAITEPLSFADVGRTCVPYFADLAALFMPEAETKFRLECLVGCNEGIRGTDRLVIDSAAQGPLSRFVENPNKIQLLDGLEAGDQNALSEVHRNLVQRLKARSAVFIPLRGRSDSLGVIGLYRHRLDTFDSRDGAFAQELADRISLGIANRELYEESQRSNRAKDEFLAIVSHELRTPLVTISGWSNILLSRQVPPETREAALQTIQRSARFQTALINDILDFSHIASGTFSTKAFEELDLRALLERTTADMQPMAQEKNIDVVTSLGVNPVLISGDADRLQQVFSNLISNAIKFTNDNGHISIKLSTNEETASVEITDTGVGIDPAFLPHVFEPFVQADGSNTRKYQGLGLGLAIARRLLNLHGARIEVLSKGQDEGATFITTFPKKNALTRAS